MDFQLEDFFPQDMDKNDDDLLLLQPFSPLFDEFEDLSMPLQADVEDPCLPDDPEDSGLPDDPEDSGLPDDPKAPCLPDDPEDPCLPDEHLTRSSEEPCLPDEHLTTNSEDTFNESEDENIDQPATFEPCEDPKDYYRRLELYSEDELPSPKTESAKKHSDKPSRRKRPEKKKSPAKAPSFLKSYRIPKRKTITFNDRLPETTPRRVDAPRFDKVKRSIYCHRKTVAVLCIGRDGFTLSNGVDSISEEGRLCRYTIAMEVKRRRVRILNCFDERTYRIWLNLKESYKDKFGTIQDCQITPFPIKACMQCKSKDCHRWNAVAGMSKLYKIPFDPIPH